jgi:uncharacterized protein (PEP-CTERM system associated)
MDDITATAGTARKPGHRLPPAILRITLGAVLLAVRTGGAAAFPLIDPSNAGQVPQGIELAEPDAQDLRHQLQLSTGFTPPLEGGWIVVPRIDVQEMLTDNALQVHQPREYDLVTYVSPGIHIAGDAPRLQMDFDFAPALTMYARTSSLNALTQHLSGIALATLVPDLAYVDVRAVAGVQNIYGGIGGLGTVGTSGLGSAQPNLTSLAGASLGSNRNNQAQTVSLGISPYLLRQFGDWGTAKLGYSLNVTKSSRMTGFFVSPFPTGGGDSQTLVTNEEVAQFTTGEFLYRTRNSFDVHLMQSETSTSNGYGTGLTGPSVQTGSFSSTRNYISDTVTYQVSRAIAVFVSGGYEDIEYNQPGGLNVQDMTWEIGATLTPDPDTSLTVSYGHLDGIDSFSANGYYAITARTTLTGSYGSTVGTQLETLQSQLNLATANGNGALVNGQNGGQLFGTTNAFALQTGVFRTDTLNLGVQTLLDRDSFSVNLMLAKQTNAGGIASASKPTTVKTVSGQWLHLLRPDVTLGTALSFSVQDGSYGFSGSGNSTSIAATVGLQRQISDTLSVSLRYSFFNRQSADSFSSYYQNMLILGISKSF